MNCPDQVGPSFVGCDPAGDYEAIVTAHLDANGQIHIDGAFVAKREPLEAHDG